MVLSYVQLDTRLYHAFNRLFYLFLSSQFTRGDMPSHITGPKPSVRRWGKPSKVELRFQENKKYLLQCRGQDNNNLSHPFSLSTPLLCTSNSSSEHNEVEEQAILLWVVMGEERIECFCNF